ncbi:hypothetical protein MKW92_007320 [Papaver armeniacum]|nr:hypothetical protein MKW92_007320 [Papaver armeniacum]
MDHPKVHLYGMEVVLTLLHHSLPSWAGSWRKLSIISSISQDLVLTECRRWLTTGVTFNEPHVFCILTYCAGTWPDGNPDMLEVAVSALPTGIFKLSMHWLQFPIPYCFGWHPSVNIGICDFV